MIVPPGLVEHFLHACEQKHLVVHRQPEDRREDEYRHDDEDGLGWSLETEQACPITVLEDEDGDPEGRADGNAVEHDRLQRDEHRAEGDQ